MTCSLTDYLILSNPVIMTLLYMTPHLQSHKHNGMSSVKLLICVLCHYVKHLNQNFIAFLSVYLCLIPASLQQYIISVLRFHSVRLSAWRMVILNWSLCNIPVHGPTDHCYPADQIWIISKSLLIHHLFTVSIHALHLCSPYINQGALGSTKL
jgi:hypothetical protein